MHVFKDWLINKAMDYVWMTFAPLGYGLILALIGSWGPWRSAAIAASGFLAVFSTFMFFRQERRRREQWREEESESLLEIAVAWKSSRPEVRHKLLCDRYRHWPAIAIMAPAVVGFTEWDEDAWNKLQNWLVAYGHAEERTRALFLPAARVMSILRRATGHSIR